jgi:hypothetical protein
MCYLTIWFDKPKQVSLEYLNASHAEINAHKFFLLPFIIIIFTYVLHCVQVGLF